MGILSRDGDLKMPRAFNLLQAVVNRLAGDLARGATRHGVL
jgi:hypothetical protein